MSNPKRYTRTRGAAVGKEHDLTILGADDEIVLPVACDIAHRRRRVAARHLKQRKRAQAQWHEAERAVGILAEEAESSIRLADDPAQKRSRGMLLKTRDRAPGQGSTEAWLVAAGELAATSSRRPKRREGNAHRSWPREAGATRQWYLVDHSGSGMSSAEAIAGSRSDANMRPRCMLLCACLAAGKMLNFVAPAKSTVLGFCHIRS